MRNISLTATLRGARRRQGLSQAALAASSGAGRVTIARLEAGAAQDFRLGTLSRLCAALGKFWYTRSYWLEGSKWMQSALSKPAQYTNMVEKAARVRTLYLDANLAYQVDDLERLKTSAELSLALAREGTNQRDSAIAKFYVASGMYKRQDYEPACLFMEQCLGEFRELNDPYWEAISYRILSYILRYHRN